MTNHDLAAYYVEKYRELILAMMRARADQLGDIIMHGGPKQVTPDRIRRVEVDRLIEGLMRFPVGYVANPSEGRDYEPVSTDLLERRCVDTPQEDWLPTATMGVYEADGLTLK